MGNEHVIPQFIERIKKKENPFKIYGGTNTRAFCYIEDAVRATQLAMTSEETNGQIINIGRSDSVIPITNLATELFKVTGYKAEIKQEPAPKGAAQRRCPDTTFLDKLNFVPKVKLQEGLAKTYEWYKNH